MSESTVTYGAIIVQSIPNFGISVWAYCSRTANPLASINSNECTALQLLTLAWFLNFIPYTKYVCTVVQNTGVFIVQWFKGTNGRQKTYEVFHVYCIFYSGFMSQTTVIFGITKDGSLESNNLASWNCFTSRNLFQNGANDMSECLTFETAFCKKAQNFV